MQVVTGYYYTQVVQELNRILRGLLSSKLDCKTGSHEMYSYGLLPVSNSYQIAFLLLLTVVVSNKQTKLSCSIASP